MNTFQMTIYYIGRLYCFLFCFSCLSAWGQAFIGREVFDFEEKMLLTELRTAQIFELPSQELLTYLREHPTEADITLQFGNREAWNIQFSLEPIQAAGYQLLQNTEKGLERLESDAVYTYRGKIVAPKSGICYLTLAEGFVYGVFEIDNKTFYIEPAQRFQSKSVQDQYLFYEETDILPNAAGKCAGVAIEEKSALLEGYEKRALSCYTVEVALAADYQMFQIFKDTKLLEKYVLAILNSVRSNYDNEFDYEIRFQAIKLWVSTCAACDPWNSTNDYETLLGSFRTWGNNGNFGVKYDLASLWTGRVMTDRNGQNIGGGGYYGVLCGSSRYNVLRRYSENAGLMRALQAHEFGHNLNADHDSTNSQTIMAPFIRDVKAWSAMSKVRINNYFASAIRFSNCLTPCATATLPTVDFFALQSSGCAPFTVQFYNHSSSNATAWEWMIEQTIISTETNPVITFAQPGLYDIRLRAKNEAGVSELVRTAMIEVKGPPEPIFTTTYQPGETTATFSATMLADSVLWKFHTGDTSKLRTSTYTFKTDGSYPVTLIAYNECGSDTLTKQIDIVTIPKAGFTAENVFGCAPLEVRFDNQSSANAATFAWEFLGGVPATSSERNPVVRYEQSGVYSVTLVVRNAAGSVTARQSNLVQVNRIPKANFSTRIDKNVLITRNLTESGSTYNWNFGDGNMSSWTNPTHTYKTAGLYNVQLIAANACGQDTLSRKIEIVGAPPKAAFIANQRNGCAPLSVTFNDLSQNEPEERRWFFAGGSPENSQQANPMVQYTLSGTYPVRLEVVNAFGKDTLIEENFVIVTDKPKKANFSWQINQLNVIFTLSENIPQNQQYEWLFGDGKRSVERQPTHTYEKPGIYQVGLVIANECGSDTLQQTITLITTSTSNWQANFKNFELFPNPNSGSFQLVLEGEAQAALQMRVITPLGQELQHTRIDFSLGKWIQTLQLNDLPNGIYWLEIIGQNGKAAKPFIVQQP